MAKKVVATLKSKDKQAGYSKVIRAVKNPNSGSYSFREETIPSETLQDYLKANGSK